METVSDNQTLQRQGHFRPVTEQDKTFLYQLYASTRMDEMAATGWPPEQIDAFLRQQFHAQSVHYDQHYAPTSAFNLILDENNQPIGRLYLQERDDEFRIIDIALLPNQRGQGIGGRILKEILQQAFDRQKKVRIHVEHNNPAMKLYKRLGFVLAEDKGIYHLMEADPAKHPSAPREEK